MVKTKAKISGLKVQDYIKSLGLLPRGKVQIFVDIEFARLTDPKVPSDTGDTRKSIFINTIFGSAIVTYSTYYKNMYEDTKKRYQDAPRRGAWWVHRMLNEGGREKIILGIQRLLARG
jgi:hypothetical protein